MFLERKRALNMIFDLKSILSREKQTSLNVFFPVKSTLKVKKHVKRILKITKHVKRTLSRTKHVKRSLRRCFVSHTESKQGVFIRTMFIQLWITNNMYLCFTYSIETSCSYSTLKYIVLNVLSTISSSFPLFFPFLVLSELHGALRLCPMFSFMSTLYTGS